MNLFNLMTLHPHSLALGIIIPLIPAIISFLLPRTKTIGLGILTYNCLGRLPIFLASKIKVSIQVITNIVNAVSRTIVDWAFGIVVASKHLNDQDRSKKIADYLNGQY